MSNYLKGTGTKKDPWVIHNQSALKYFFEVGILSYGYAVLSNDIDMNNVTVASDTYENMVCNIDGYGHAIKNINIAGGVKLQKAIWRRIRFVNLSSSWPFFQGYNNQESFVSDCEFDGIKTPSHNSYIAFTRCVARNLASNINNYYGVDNCFVVDGDYTFNNFTNLTSKQDRYSESNYPALLVMPDLWVIDGYSMPRLIGQPSEFLSQAYAVKGVVRIGNQRKQRRVMGLSPSDHHEIASVISNEDGTYLLNVGYYTDNIFVSCGDDYGLPLAKNKEYVIGEIIHPITVNGYRYVCDKAGNSGDALPSEPWSVEELLTVGTARFKADPVFQPMIAGPIKPRLIDLITGDPV